MLELGLGSHRPPRDSQLPQAGFFHANWRSSLRSDENDHETGTETLFITTQFDDKSLIIIGDDEAKTAYERPLRHEIGFKFSPYGNRTFAEQLKKVKS